MNLTKIEYLDRTWNPISGCSPVSQGCENCWAQKMAKRLQAMGVKGYENGFTPTVHPERLDEPLKVRVPSVVGVSFMGDLFHKDIPYSFIDSVWSRIAQCPHHTFLILTKRPERMARFVNEVGVFNYGILSNMWLGVTMETYWYSERMDILKTIPAKVRFLSIEPMLMAMPDNMDLSGISWVICGAESGPGKRHMEIEWVRSLKDQCVNADIPFFFKQMVALSHGWLISMPALDGQRWDQMPKEFPK